MQSLRYSCRAGQGAFQSKLKSRKGVTTSSCGNSKVRAIVGWYLTIYLQRPGERGDCDPRKGGLTKLEAEKSAMQKPQRVIFEY